ncbi:MAG: hypothetical protein E7651_07930 [Ruminococcaceae bacterium]|nr:hypothetical protein [Oscillospiraceae bacterium]MBQ8324016.1 hypothetical protein [Clostridia bacterium]
MKAKEIFEQAMDLCALRGSDGDGEPRMPGDLSDLSVRAVGILNVLMGEMHPLEERLTGQKRPYARIYGLEETVDLCEGICRCVLPYRLAALLIAEEDRELYDLLILHAREAAKGLLQDGASYRHSILEVYQ